MGIVEQLSFRGKKNPLQVDVKEVLCGGQGNPSSSWIEKGQQQEAC